MRKILTFTFALALALALAPSAAADSCSATKTCSSTSVSCSGSSSCIVGSNYVECDGQRTSCPSGCSASYTCPTPEYDQEYIVACSTSSGSCSVDNVNDSVTCGSTTRTCAGCEAGLYPCIVIPSPCLQGAFCFDDSDCGLGGSCDFLGRCQCELQ